MTKLIDKLSFLLTPNGYKAGSLYPYKPLDNRPAYAWLPGVSGNSFTTPNAVVNQITGDIDIIAYIVYSNNGGAQTVVSKGSAAPNNTYELGVSSTNLLFMQYNISGYKITQSSTGIGNNYTGWIRLTRNSSTGEFLFYTSSDSISTPLNSINWLQLGTSVVGTAGAPVVFNTSVVVGSSFTTELQRFQGVINRVCISNSIGGSPVVDFNPAGYNRATSQTTWTSATGETWTINGTLAYIKEALLNIPFTRNSIATRLNQSGNIETVQANVPRIHYPIPNQCPVFLMEPPRTNLFLRSEEFENSYWTQAAPLTNRTANQGIAPDGQNTADKISESANTQEFKIFRNSVTGLTTSTNYCISVFAKAQERSFFFIQNSSGTGARFDLTNGVVAGSRPSAPVSSGIENYGNGWYRCWIVLSSGAGTSMIPEIGLLADNNNTSSYAGVAGSGILIWGAQFEQGSYPTTYIPTQGSTITRLADSITNLVSNYGSVAIGTKGTIHFDVTMAVAPTVENFTFMFGNQYQNASNGIRLRLWSTGAWSFRDTITGSDITPNLPINTRTRVTFVIDGRIVLTYINGVFYSRWTRPTLVDIQRITAMLIPSDGGILHLHELAISQDLLTPEEIAQLSNDYTTSQELQTLFQARVSADSGILESSSSLGAYLTSLQNINLA